MTELAGAGAARRHVELLDVAALAALKRGKNVAMMNRERCGVIHTGFKLWLAFSLEITYILVVGGTKANGIVPASDNPHNFAQL